jgi:pimeloyl-ACP methyl ester carboxylesterase
MAYLRQETHQIFFTIKGKGNQLIILLPGNTSSSIHLQGEVDYFAQFFQTAAVDFWGTGKSDRLLDWEDSFWNRAADDTIALISHLGFKNAVLIGISGGGIVALLAAALYPQRVQAVIADSCAKQINFPKVLDGRSLNPLEIFSQEKSVPAALRRIALLPILSAFWKRAHGNDWRQVVDADSRFLQVLKAAGGDIFKGRLRDVCCPVLLTASLEDEMLLDPAKQQVMIASQLTLSKVHIEPHGGAHPFAWNSPQRFRRVAYEFLQSVLSGEEIKYPLHM